MHQISSGPVLMHVFLRSLELCQYFRFKRAAGLYERRVDGLATPRPLGCLAGTDTMPMKMNENICIESGLHPLEALQHLRVIKHCADCAGRPGEYQVWVAWTPWRDRSWGA